MPPPYRVALDNVFIISEPPCHKKLCMTIINTIQGGSDKMGIIITMYIYIAQAMDHGYPDNLKLNPHSNEISRRRQLRDKALKIE